MVTASADSWTLHLAEISRSCTLRLRCVEVAFGVIFTSRGINEHWSEPQVFISESCSDLIDARCRFLWSTAIGREDFIMSIGTHDRPYANMHVLPSTADLQQGYSVRSPNRLQNRIAHTIPSAMVSLRG